MLAYRKLCNFIDSLIRILEFMCDTLTLHLLEIVLCMSMLSLAWLTLMFSKDILFKLLHKFGKHLGYLVMPLVVIDISQFHFHEHHICLWIGTSIYTSKFVFIHYT